MLPDQPVPTTPDDNPAGTLGRGDETSCAEREQSRVLVEVLPPGSAARRARTLVRETLRQAGVGEEAVAEAVLVASELAANAERHARPPFELRILHLRGVPYWCEVVDRDDDPGPVEAQLDALRAPAGRESCPLAENGRGLLLAYRLSAGQCEAYPTTLTSTGSPGKAVAFALPTVQANRPAPSSPVTME